jgi:hypothetical protein
MDRQQGFIQSPASSEIAEKAPFMTMAVGVVSASKNSFADIREITELSAEARRQDAASGG